MDIFKAVSITLVFLAIIIVSILIVKLDDPKKIGYFGIGEFLVLVAGYQQLTGRHLLGTEAGGLYSYDKASDKAKSNVNIGMIVIGLAIITYALMG